MKYTAEQIKKLLKQKHLGDIIVIECKNGSTWYTSEHLKFDAWVMKKKWAKPLVIIYEVKVSRSDFNNDYKWKSYLEYCNEFYFVCPPHIIEPNELPPEAGLLWTSVNCARLYNKKNSIYRENIEIPEDLFRYILMWRAEIRDEKDSRWDRNSSKIDKIELWKEWLEEKKLKKSIGTMVSEKIRTNQSELLFENDRLKKRINTFEEIEKFCEEHDIHLSNYMSWTVRDVRKKIDEFELGLSEKFIYDLNQATSSLKKLSDHINPKTGEE